MPVTPDPTPVDQASWVAKQRVNNDLSRANALQIACPFCGEPNWFQGAKTLFLTNLLAGILCAVRPQAQTCGRTFAVDAVGRMLQVGGPPPPPYPPMASITQAVLGSAAKGG